MPRTIDFLAPSLHPNSLLDISYPEPGPSTHEPIVRHLAVKHGTHQPVGNVKRIVSSGEDSLIVADDVLRISTLRIGCPGSPSPPEVIAQCAGNWRKGDVWAGLIPAEGSVYMYPSPRSVSLTISSGVISALTSGQLTLHSSSSSRSDSACERSVPFPLLALSSSGPSSTTFALAGKEVDISVWDVERTFSSCPSHPIGAGGKRKKNELEPGEIWRARNLPNNSLQIRQPVHHLSLAHLPESSTSIVSGTKAGTVRRYDTRQRRPVSDWKVAREGGVGCVAPGSERELFFADRSNLVGGLDLRTGRLLYSYSSMTCSAHHLLPIPQPEGGGSHIGLASIASDATLRLHSTVPFPEDGTRGNPVREGKKPKIVGMVGAVGVGSAVFRGWGEMAKGFHGTEDGYSEAEAGADEEDVDGERGVWEAMSEVENDEDSEAEDVLVKRRKN